MQYLIKDKIVPYLIDPDMAIKLDPFFKQFIPS